MKTVAYRELEAGQIVRPAMAMDAQAPAFSDRIVVYVDHKPDGTGTVKMIRPHATAPYYKDLGVTTRGYSRCEEWLEWYTDGNARAYYVVGEAD